MKVAVWPYFTFFFFNDTATTEIYTLSLHDALPISFSPPTAFSDTSTSKVVHLSGGIEKNTKTILGAVQGKVNNLARDRKSTRLNSSHDQISYAVFCLKKKQSRNLGKPRRL